MLLYFRQLISGNLGFPDFLIILGSMCFVVFCATPLHEYAHALTAVKLGDDTPRLRGRLTINPMAHISWTGALMIFIFGFGYAKPVEVRMRHFKNPKRDMAIVALAGPLCNLLQAFVYMLLCSVFGLGLFARTGAQVFGFAAVFFQYAAYINISLAVFNLIPIPPLDGSRLLTALLPAKYYYKLMEYERYIVLALFFLLFTGILSRPLSWLSGLIASGMQYLTALPFGGVG